MRDRRVRVGIVGLLLLFPALAAGASPRAASVREAVVPVLATEAVLVVGLAGALGERRRLLAERVAPAVSRTRPLPSVPHAGRALSRAPVGRV